MRPAPQPYCAAADVLCCAVQSADRPRKWSRREPSTPSARHLIASVQAAVREWHRSSEEATLRVAQGCRPAERVFAYQALEALQLGDAGSPGFYVEKVGERAVWLRPVPARSTQRALSSCRPADEHGCTLRLSGECHCGFRVLTAAPVLWCGVLNHLRGAGDCAARDEGDEGRGGGA